ncbi:unnamed protein product, partial [Polarella glacialis]
LLYALLGVLAVTPDAMLLRQANDFGGSTWQLIFWRYLGLANLGVPIVIWMSGGPRQVYDGLRSSMRCVVTAAMIQGFASIGITVALMGTDTARALTLVSLTPIWAALLSRIFLKDVLPWRTVALLVAGMLAIALVFLIPTLLGGDPERGSSSSLFGDLLATAAGIAMAIYLTYLQSVRRHNPNLPIF